MKKLAILGIIVCVGLLVGSAAVIGGPAGPPEGLDVNVVNQDPIPVTGDLNATVSGDVNATVTGEVEVTNMPDVTVANTPDNAVPVTVQTVYRFARFSDTRTKGDTGGIGGMHQICQTDLNDTSARMCTTKELLLSPNSPTFGAPSAWVQPTIVSTVIESGVIIRCDYSGICFTREDANCFGWVRSDDGARGIFFNNGIIVTSAFCDTDHRVACCTPTN